MAAVPLIRRFTRAAPGALDTFALAVDEETGLTFIRITSPNVILDMVNDPNPAAGARYEIRIIKGGIDTGRRIYSLSIDPMSAGRIAVGPITLGPGDYSFSVAQRAGALAAYSFIVKFARAP